MPDAAHVEDFFYDSADGLRLHLRLHGEKQPDAAPIVCLPGLTRNHRDFSALAARLAQDSYRPRQVVCFDYRGRGLSQYDADWKKYEIGVETSDIISGLDTLGITKAHFIGTSRGGLIAHVLAVLRPEMLQSVVFNDVGPVLEPAGLALIKSYLNAPTVRLQTFKQAADVQKALHREAFGALDDNDWLDVAHALYREINGEIRPDFDPALLNGLAAFDLSQPVPTLWPQFEAMNAIPLMVIRGENSLLLSPETVSEMKKHHPALEIVVARGQGHAPILHKFGIDRDIADFFRRSD
ncbi:MAG: alpha/beta hydrolase [Rhizobiaceae bacterium]|nr:alpha/beta hydrolase [Rhizobiaceae bacterium]